MQKLLLSPKFLESLEKDDKVIKTMRIYGYFSKSQFLESLMKLLNSEYDFLNISSVDEYPSEMGKDYHMYNGYVEGDIEPYNEINISLTVMKDGKLGNVFITQQIVPMITSKLEKNKMFLLDEKIKNICLLTTHLSSHATPDANQLNGMNNTGSMVIKILNSLNIDVQEFFPLINSNTNASYNSLPEFLDHIGYINSSKPSNVQYDHVRVTDNKVQVSFDPNEKVHGQTIKFVLLKALGAIHLSGGQLVSLADMIERTKIESETGKPAQNILVVNNYAEYVFKNNLIKEEADIFDDDSSSIEAQERVPFEKDIDYSEPDDLPEYLKKPVYTFNKNGKKVYKTFKDKKVKAFEIHSYYCSCHSEEHYYFTSHATRERYVEGHHMIPMEYQNEYWNHKKINLDATINLVPLCPHCHQKIHKAVKFQRLDVIKELYEKYESNLKILDSSMDLEKFASFYNVYVY
jgi:5-methylcytosine-specific restriction protein A